MLKEGRHFPYMNGREVFKNAVRRFPEVIQEALDANDLSIDDISLIIPHQANERITTTVRKKLGIEKSKIFSNIHKFGNTTGASIHIALCDAYEQGKISENCPAGSSYWFHRGVLYSPVAGPGVERGVQSNGR